MARRKYDPGPAGETLEAFLEEQGIRDEVYEHALKAVLAWQLGQEMKRQKLSKAALAKRLGTSRTEIYRVLDPENEAVSLGTLKKAAAAVGKKLRLELVDAP
jgi:antitoxin HicB